MSAQQIRKMNGMYGEAERMSAAGVEIQETTAADAAGIGRRPASAFWRPCSGRFLREQGYPESLIALVERNPETKDFVLDYPKYKGLEEIDISKDVMKGEIPHFLQWDERWGYETYGSDFLAVTGCGPTCLSMVTCGLTGDTQWNPYEVAKMAEDNGYYVDGSGSSWDLMSSGAEKLGLTVSSVIFDAEHIRATLEAGQPIICVMGPGDFTDAGHFLVLTGVDKNGDIILQDPNSVERTKQHWDVQKLMNQMKNLWAYSC